MVNCIQIKHIIFLKHFLWSYAATLLSRFPVKDSPIRFYLFLRVLADRFP